MWHNTNPNTKTHTHTYSRTNSARNHFICASLLLLYCVLNIVSDIVWIRVILNFRRHRQHCHFTVATKIDTSHYRCELNSLKQNQRKTKCVTNSTHWANWLTYVSVSKMCSFFFVQHTETLNRSSAFQWRYTQFVCLLACYGCCCCCCYYRFQIFSFVHHFFFLLTDMHKIWAGKATWFYPRTSYVIDCASSII